MKTLKEKKRASQPTLTGILLQRRAMHTNLLQKAKPILAKAVRTGELDFMECGKIETRINECIKYPALSLSEKHAGFLLKKMYPSMQHRIR